MNKNIKSIVEGLLFIYGEEGISLVDLQNVLEDCRASDIQEVILDLQKKYASSEESAFSIQKFGKNKYRLQTKPELHDFFAKLEIAKNHSRLSNSCIEVLSIVTYKGPVSKNEIEAMRNSDCSYQLYKLKNRKLIKSVGKTPTGANMYTITDNFFKLFNIQGGLEALPAIELSGILSKDVDYFDEQNNQDSSINKKHENEQTKLIEGESLNHEFEEEEIY